MCSVCDLAQMTFFMAHLLCLDGAQLQDKPRACAVFVSSCWRMRTSCAHRGSLHSKNARMWAHGHGLCMNRL